MVASWAVGIVALLCLSGLFAIAHLGDSVQRGWQDTRLRATIYALTLAVYCTSWTFYGSVGFAASNGYDFLAIYFGPILVIGFGWRFVQRIVRLAKTQNILSIADFTAARYGKNARVAAIVALIAVIGTIPYIALQLKAISSSLKTAIDPLGEKLASETFPLFGDMALVVAVVLALFTTTFGARQIDSREHHSGLMFAIAVESLVKLIAFLGVGFFVVYGMFGGFSGLNAALGLRPDIIPLEARSGGILSIVTMTLLSASIILLLPRQFHVLIVENRNEQDIKQSAWMFPLYLILINIFVAPIVLASDLIFPPGMIDRDMAVLALPLKAGSEFFALLAFVGGFSAATAMVIVECVALGTMVSNDLIMPLILRLSSRATTRLADDSHAGDLGNRILLIRRLAILVVIFCGYQYFRVTEQVALASIGLISFSAIAQIAPSFFGGMLWRRANARGATAGMVSGFAIWAYTLAIPNIATPGSALYPLVEHGPFGLEFLKPTALFGLNMPFIAHGALLSLVVNIVFFVGFSFSRQPKPIERLQASLFVSPDRPLIIRNFRFRRASVTIGELKSVVSRYLGVERTEVAFANAPGFAGDPAQDKDEAGLAILRFAEHQLASAIGAASSRRVLSMLLSRSNVSRSEALRLLDDASAAMQHNRDLLQHALDHARQGVTVFDANLRLLLWNQEFQSLFLLPDSMMRIGTSLESIVTYNAERGLYGTGRTERLTARRLESFVNDRDPVRVRLFPDERTVEIRSAHLPDGGIVTTYTDITDTVRAEEALAASNESLEGRVRERTMELLRLNDELSRAKAAADDANLSKTKFLAAASHDILQPLNAARLYASSLIERDQRDGTPDLALSLATSLEAVEDILMTLLDISRLDAGAMRAEITSFRLADVFSGIKTDLEPMAREKHIDLTFVPTSLSVKSDRRLLRRLIQNLVSNAIKYTPTGRVLVGVRRRKTKLRLEVWDTGVGIPLSQQKLVFDEFQRLDDGAKLARGLGLGLSIVERIARLLRHPLKLQSEVGKGSVFSIEIPISQAVPEMRISQDMPTLSTPLAGMAILAIDNEPTILDAMERLLKGWGCDVLLAANLKNAREVVADFTSGPDIIIADYHLDDGATGLEAITALREEHSKDYPAILVTADRSQLVREEADALRVTVLHKPLKPAALRALLAQWRSKTDVSKAAE